jgi:hypothetical protein
MTNADSLLQILIAHNRLTADGLRLCGDRVPLCHMFTDHQADAIIAAGYTRGKK